MSTIAIIPARGGSKRIPKKNIKLFLGKPIIAYSIEVALRSNLFDEVMVSTDSEEIASIAKGYGAQVPFMRSEKNSDDFASTVDVITEVIERYSQRGKRFDYGCCIYPTAPFVKVEKLVEGFRLLKDERYDSVFPITPFGNSIWRSLKIDGRKVSMIWPENMAKRSQDLPQAYHDAGQWYWFSIEKILSERKLWTENTFGVELSEMEVQDIDNETDWQIAEMKYRLSSNQPVSED